MLNRLMNLYDKKDHIDNEIEQAKKIPGFKASLLCMAIWQDTYTDTVNEIKQIEHNMEGMGV